jgi:hypothetical protein
MRRRLGVLGVLVAVATTALALPAAPAFATPTYPGAGFVVAGVGGMTVNFTIPAVRCMSGETDATIFGVVSPWIGQLEGWNATAVVGCTNSQPWYRIQTWVNAVGGGHSVADASPGDRVEARLIYANTRRPELMVTDWTSNYRVVTWMNQSESPATVAAAGAYGGAMVPNFGMKGMTATVNAKPLGDVLRTRRNLVRQRITRVATGYLWPDNESFTLCFKHH